MRCVILVPDGASRRVGPNGLLIGRQLDSDLVAPDPSVSRRHALIRLTATGAELVPLGRAPVQLNGTPHHRPQALADGDELELPGLALKIQLTAERPEPDAPARFRIERARGGSFGLVHSPFLIGGDVADDLIVPRWPAHALILHVAQRELFVEVSAATTAATRNGVALEASVVEPLATGDVLGYRREEFTIRQAPTRADTTVVGAGFTEPTQVTIEILPRGGRLVVATSDGDHAVYLADRRLDLMIALLRPTEGYLPGEFIPDDVVSAVVWPRSAGGSRVELNVLIARCRKDLIDAGLAGPRLIQRAPGGGGTRFAVAPGARIEIKG